MEELEGLFSHRAAFKAWWATTAQLQVVNFRLQWRRWKLLVMEIELMKLSMRIHSTRKREASMRKLQSRPSQRVLLLLKKHQYIQIQYTIDTWSEENESLDMCAPMVRKFPNMGPCPHLQNVAGPTHLWRREHLCELYCTSPSIILPGER